MIVHVSLPNIQSIQLIGVYAQGNLFSFYELCRNFKWTIEDEKVSEKVHIFPFFFLVNV